MRILALSSALVPVAAGAVGAALLPRSAIAQGPGQRQPPIMAQDRFLVFQDNRVQIPLRDEGGAVRATLTYVPGASGKGAVTITDRNGARIDLLAASDLAALPPLDVNRIRLPAGAGDVDSGKADGGSNDRFLKEEFSKLDARVKQLEAKLRR